MNTPHSLRAIIFDCDGVLLESVDAKTEAYRSLFAEHRRHLAAILEYHHDNGGVSRYDKIRHIYRHILHQPLSEQGLMELCARFTTLSFEGVLAAPLVQGVHEFLRVYHDRLHLFVASGTPQEELETLLKLRGLRPYFCDVFGSPSSKREILGQILGFWGLTPGAVVMVGDAPTDLQASEAWGIRFIGRISRSQATALPPRVRHNAIVDFFDLAELLKDLLPRNPLG